MNAGRIIVCAVSFFAAAAGIDAACFASATHDSKTSPAKASVAKTSASVSPSLSATAKQHASSGTEPRLSADEWKHAVATLRQMDLRIPLNNFDPERMKGSFYEMRGTGRHEATDMLAPRNTPIHAVCDGRIAKLFLSRFGGTTIYQFDPQERFVFYYAHLQSYAPGLKDGQLVHKGDVIAFVGTSGNAPPNTPHLHLSISVLGKEKQWWKAAPLDPYEVFAHRPMVSGK